MKSKGRGLYRGRVSEKALLTVTVLVKVLVTPPVRPVVVTVIGKASASKPTYSTTNLMFSSKSASFMILTLILSVW